MRRLCAWTACAAALGLCFAISVDSADARRGGKSHAGSRNLQANVNRSRNVNRNVTRNVDRNVTRNVNRNVKYVWHNGRRGYWRAGVFIVAPAVAGAAYVASCAYEYDRWQSSGSSYWRDRYYACVN